MPRFKAIRLCRSLLDNLISNISTEQNLKARMDLAQEIWVCCIEGMSNHLSKKQDLILFSSLESEPCVEVIDSCREHSIVELASLNHLRDQAAPVAQ